MFNRGLVVGKGLWKLGARFYDSGKGSFIQQDRYMGDPSDPFSLNRYVYCGLDPVNFVDPTEFSRTAQAALSLSWLTMIDGPVLPIGDILYASIVVGIAVGEYGPMLIDLGSKMYQSANSQGNSSSSGQDPNNYDKKGGFQQQVADMKNKSLRSCQKNLQQRILEHQAKINSDPTNQAVKHWQHEIDVWNQQLGIVESEMASRGL